MHLEYLKLKGLSQMCHFKGDTYILKIFKTRSYVSATYIYLNILVSKLEMAVSEIFMPVRQA